MTKKKEKHTTFEVGPIPEPRMRALMEGLWKSAPGAYARGALREELLPLYYRQVLKPAGDFAGGCGTPFLCQHPDGGVIYFLFTGWPTTSSDGREVYVGEINGDFKVTNTRKIITSNFPTANYPTHATVSVLYDPYNDQWIVFTGSGSYGSLGLPTTHFETCLWRFNRDFTRMVSYQAPLNITPEGGVPQVWSSDDVAPNLIRVSKSSAEPMAYFITMGALSPVAEYKNMYWGWTDNISAPVPTFVRQVTPLVSKLTGDGWGGSLMSMDVYTLIMSRYGFMVLVEAPGTEGYFRLFPIYINQTPETATTSTRHALGGMGFDSLLHPAGSYDAFPFGHPHLTFLPDSKLNLFFSFFRNFPPSYRHEIWHVKFTEEMFDPAKQRAIYFTPWYSQLIGVNESSLPWFAFRKTTIYFTASVAGDLTIEVSPAGSVNEWWTLDKLTGITSAIYSTEHEAKAMRLRFSAGANVTAIVVVSPRG